MDQHEYYKESIELQKKQIRATESQENWLQTLMGYVFIVGILVAYVVACIVLLAIHYWYIWTPAVIVIVAVCKARKTGHQAGTGVLKETDRLYKYRSFTTMEEARKEFAGTEFADLYEPKGRGCKEPR